MSNYVQSTDIVIVAYEQYTKRKCQSTVTYLAIWIYSCIRCYISQSTLVSSRQISWISCHVNNSANNCEFFSSANSCVHQGLQLL